MIFEQKLHSLDLFFRHINVPQYKEYWKLGISTKEALRAKLEGSGPLVLVWGEGHD